MDNLKLSNVPEQIQNVVSPFFESILANYRENIVSMYVIGSAVTKSFDAKRSDINTLIIVKENQIAFFDFIAALGKSYGKKRMSAPFIMTQDYINRSLEVFPIEFLDMKLINQLVYGDNVLESITLEKPYVRLQCERELKGEIQHLCHGYIKSMGNNRTMADLLTATLSSFFPLFRAIIFLYGYEVPKEKGDVLYAINECCGVDVSIFKTLMDMKARGIYPQIATLREVFENLYKVLNVITKNVDEFEI